MQLPPGANVAPDKDTDDEPAVAVAVAPLQVVFRLLGVATTSPAGRLSVNAIPFNVEFTLLLLMEKVRLVVPLRGMVAAPKALLIDGGLMTVRLADDVFPLPASVESIVTLFEYTLSVALCTFTLIVHVPTARAELLKLMLPALAVAVTVPPQLLTTLGVVATTNPEGNESVKLELMATTLPFVIENVTALAVLVATVVGLKLLTMEGGCSTTMSAVTVKLSTVASACPCPPVPPAL